MLVQQSSRATVTPGQDAPRQRLAEMLIFTERRWQ